MVSPGDRIWQLIYPDYKWENLIKFVPSFQTINKQVKHCVSLFVYESDLEITDKK